MRFNSNWKALAVWLHMFFSFKWKYDFYRGVKQSFEDKVFFNIKGEIPVFDLLYQTMKLHISKQSEIIFENYEPVDSCNYSCNSRYNYNLFFIFPSLTTVRTTLRKMQPHVIHNDCYLMDSQYKKCPLASFLDFSKERIFNPHSVI